MRLNLAALTLIAMTTPALADPVSIGAAVTAIGSWWASIGVVGQTLVYAASVLALTGMSYLLNGGARAESAQRDRLPSVNVPERDGLLEKVRLYGIDTTPGAVFYQRVKNGSLYLFGVVVSEGECDSLDAMIINGVECKLNASGFPVTEPWFDGSNTYFQASFRSGSDSQAIDPLIDANFPDEGADFRQRGVCTIVVAMQFGSSAEHHATLWGTGGIPQILFRVKGLKVYDPRDAAQVLGTKSTWKWSDTATLVQADWLTTRMGFGMDRARLDEPSIIESANIDDAFVPTLSGLEKSGRVNGRAFSSESNIDVLNSMMQQNRGILRKTGGVFGIRADRASEPVSTIHDGLLAGDLSAQNEPDTRSALNTVYAEFRPYAKFNQSAETSYQNAALLAAHGEEFSTRVSLRFCDSPPVAQRLCYGLVTENSVASTRTINVNAAALYAPGKANKTLEQGDVTRLAFRFYPSLDGIYTVNKIDIMSDMTLLISLTGYTPLTISGWSLDKEVAFNG